MKKLLSFLILAAAAVAAAMLIELPMGSVTIVVPPYRVDLSVQAAVAILLVFLLVFLVLLRLVFGLVGIPEQVRLFRRKRLQDRRLKTLAALIADYLEGRFSRVLKSAREIRAQPDLLHDAPEVAAAGLALAASAAHQMHDHPARDGLLKEVKSLEYRGRAADPVIAPLLEAQFLIDERQGRKAVEALKPLTGGDRRHIHTQRLLLKAHQQQAAWDEVLRLTRLLENRKAITGLAALRYKQQVAQAWISEGRHQEARRLIETTLEGQWDSGLCMLYADCQDQPKEQLARLEKWLQQHPQDPELNWALGRICQRQELWGKARMHLEASLRQRPMMATHLALAEIAEALGQKETAAIQWKAAAQFPAVRNTERTR
jgi:HemY protein